MPGIAGIISKRYPEICEREVRMMIGCMMHEPFYIGKFYINDQLGVYVGQVSHIGSFSDCMPVFNEKRDLVLMFSGENFADEDSSNQLKRNGHDFDSTNASFLIHLYEEEGEGFLKKLNGWFSGILVDLRREEVIIFNDRYGMGRIYYHEGQEGFLFSSEAKSLLKIEPRLRELELGSLGELFSCGCTLENKSLFTKIFLLPGGSAWTLNNKGKRVIKDSYFGASVWESQDPLTKEDFYQKLRDTFNTILPRYFKANDHIGMSLTGGLDTRAILACMDNPPGGLPCYTFGGLDGDTFDIRVARKVADAYCQTHEVLRVDERFLSDFSVHSEKTIYVSDGCSDVCGAHEVYLNNLARGIAPIRMTGNYGGEVLRSVSNFGPSPLNEDIFSEDFKKYIRQGIETSENINKGDKLSFAVFKEIPWHMYGCHVSAQSQVVVRSPYMDNDLVGLVYQAPADVRSNNETVLRLIADNNSSLSKILTDMGVGAGCSGWVLKCVQVFYKFLFRLEWYYNVGMPHWMISLDKLLRPLRPERLLLGWHRYLHYRSWFRNELSNYVQQMLLDRRTLDRPYLKREVLETIVSRHINGRGNYTNEINKVLTAELIQRLLIEKI